MTKNEDTAFVPIEQIQLRDRLASNQELAQKFAELERKLTTHDRAITGILKAIQELMSPLAQRRRSIGFTADILREYPFATVRVIRAASPSDSIRKTCRATGNTA